jgi:hypothetical protein
MARWSEATRVAVGPDFEVQETDRSVVRIDAHVARYLHQLDSADRREPSAARTINTTRLKEKSNPPPEAAWTGATLIG